MGLPWLLPQALTMITALVTLVSCATPNPLPAGTMVLGEIAYVASADEALRGFRYVPHPNESFNGSVPAPEDAAPVKKLLSQCGLDTASAATHWSPSARGVVTRGNKSWLALWSSRRSTRAFWRIWCCGAWLDQAVRREDDRQLFGFEVQKRFAHFSGVKARPRGSLLCL